MKHVAVLVLPLVCAGFAPSALSQIVKCRAESGQLVYTEEKCPPGTRPLELSESLPSAARAAPAVAAGTVAEKTPALSTRALELREFVFDCAFRGSPARCNEYQQIYQGCREKQNRNTADCRALIELLPLAREAMVEDLIKHQQDVCRQKGNRDDCERLACSITPDHWSEDDQLQACSHAKGLPSSKSWAQFSEEKDQAGNWTGLFVCLPKFHYLGPVGERMSQRGIVRVEAQMSGGRPTGNYLVFGRLYPDVKAAADVECAEKNARLAEKQQRDAQAMGAGS